jgi:short-subunit dehydrogenase
LAARRTEILDCVARECLELGAKGALAIPTDVTKPHEVQHLADSVFKEWNRIDVWVNDPGVGAIGPFEEVPVESHDRVIAINLLGYIHGAHAVVPYFKRQGSGILINMNSLGAWCPLPYGASYAASKFGLRAFSDSLRGELSKYSNIHVCDLFPGCVDSPGFRNSANYTGVFLKPPPPLISPQRVARKIVQIAENPKPRTMMGVQSWGARFAYFIAPQLMVRIMARSTDFTMKFGREIPMTDGNLAQESQWESISGEWRKPLTQQLKLALPIFGLISLFCYFKIVSRDFRVRI